MTRRLLPIAFAAALGLGPLVVAQAAEPAADPTAEELLNRVDDFARGDSSFAKMRMTVKTSRYERSMEMEAWSKGTERSLIRITAPAKEAGVSTLKVEDNIWNYMPKVDRTIKVPSGMMSGSWMGSHISNDDLVKENRLADEFTYAITGRPDGEQGSWVVEAIPKPDAPVVWGKVEAEVGFDRQPRAVRYYDEDGELVRTMSFAEVKEFDGETLPTVMRVEPADKPGEYTQITYLELDFGVAVDDSRFTLQSLRK